VADFLNATTCATTTLVTATTLRLVTALAGAFALVGAFCLFNTIGAAVFALVAVETGCFFGVFLVAAASFLASFSWAAFAFFSVVLFFFSSSSSFFLRVFTALLIFLSNLACSSAALNASFFF
jgi:hypothetical protein